MFTAAVVLIIVVAILLILVVLIQNSKGGLNQSMGSASNQLMGVKKTSDILEKLTWGLAIGLMALCLATNFLIERPGINGEEPTSVNVEKAQESGSMGGAQQPAQPQQPVPADSGK